MQSILYYLILAFRINLIYIISPSKNLYVCQKVIKQSVTLRNDNNTFIVFSLFFLLPLKLNFPTINLF